MKLELNWFRISIRQFLQVVISARYFVIANLASLIYLKSDVLIVKYRFSAIDAAQYGAMLRLVEPFTAIAMAFSTVIIARNVKNYDSFSFRPIMFITVLGLFFSVALSNFSEDIVATLYSEDYRHSGELLRWYSWTILFVFIKNLSWSFFIQKGLIKIVTFSNLLSASLYAFLVFFTDLLSSPLEMTKITLVVYSISAVAAPLIFYILLKKDETKIKKHNYTEKGL
jgi:O-antigen/teichoic acid export membrane protein